MKQEILPNGQAGLHGQNIAHQCRDSAHALTLVEPLIDAHNLTYAMNAEAITYGEKVRAYPNMSDAEKNRLTLKMTNDLYEKSMWQLENGRDSVSKILEQEKFASW